mgnify:CR=1 FL=1
MLILVIFFTFFDVFSSISINQSQILMKKLTKWSKKHQSKKGWFYSKEMLLFCWSKKWYLDGFYPFADDEKAVIGKIRTRSLQKQPFHHQQMITDHPNFNLTTDKKICFFNCFFSTFLKSTFLLIFQPFLRKNHQKYSFLIKFWCFPEEWHHY